MLWHLPGSDILVSTTPNIRFARLSNLIIQGYLNYQDSRWVMYDRQFCQKASTTSVPDWSAIDMSLWNLAFCSHVTGHHGNKPQKTAYLCKDPPQACSTSWKFSSWPKKLEWNDIPSNDCPYPACRYEHICYRYAHNPSITDKYHKAMFCPHREKQAP